MIEATAAMIRETRGDLAAEVARRMRPTGADVSGEPAERAKKLPAGETENLLLYLAEAVETSDPGLFLACVAWTRSVHEGRTLPEGMIETTIEVLTDVLGERLPEPSKGTVLDMLRTARLRLRAAPESPPSFLDGSPAPGLSRDYLGAILDGERWRASRLILEAVEDGMSVQDVYLHVFQPVLREIGRLWQMNLISVAREHFCTAVTQLVMSQLYPRIFSSRKIGRRLVGACVSDELHEIGLRMVTDFFEMEGWDTTYLGANVPAESVVETLRERDADVLAISATMTFHVDPTRELIRMVRSSDRGERVRILVGGYPFNLSERLWRHVGADAHAADAAGAVALGNRLFERA